MKKKNFGEQEYDFFGGRKIPVTITPKYLSTKEKVIAIMDKYELSEGDFWILKNYDKEKTKCFYSGLIISHEALVKINDTLNEKFNEKFCSDPIRCDWCGVETLRMDYRDPRDGMYEVGEISTRNCKNDYPYAMLLKRVFDRVVKRKAKLSMVYSDSEADEFRVTEEKVVPKATEEQVKRIINMKDVIMDELMQRGIHTGEDVHNLTIEEASKLCRLIEERLNG